MITDTKWWNRRRILVALLAVSVFSGVSQAEDFNIEFTAGYWPLKPSGNIQTSSTRVDLRSDLGIQGRKSQAMFKTVLKPASKHRITVEGVPYRLNGANTVSSPFTLGGRTYAVQDSITSDANVDYLFGGYQYDVVNKSRGHAGIGGGIAYFGADASATSESSADTGREERKVAVPLAGGEFRFFPFLPEILNINGEVKGMSLGSRGHYVQGNISAGFTVARSVRLQAGFNVVDADVHKTDLTKRFKLLFAGPIFSVQLHD